MTEKPKRRRVIITDADIFSAFERWCSPGLKNKKLFTSNVREALLLLHPGKAILQYDVRQKLKNMAARGLVTEVRLNPNSTAWMIDGDQHGKN